MPDHKPPPPATLVDTLPDLPEPPAVNPRAVTAAKYTAPMLTLPQIVAAVRQQKPGVVPDALHWAATLEYWNWCPDDEKGATEDIPEPVAIAVLEAALWRALSSKPGRSVDLRHWGWFATAERQTGGGLCFGSDPLALCRALCHAIGVRLEIA